MSEHHTAMLAGCELIVVGRGNRSLLTRPGEVLLDAMVREGVPVAYCCKAGLCGMCRAHLHSGSVQHLQYSERALTAEDARRGQILTCRAVPLTSCSIEPLETLESANRESARLATVMSIEEIDLSGLCRVTLKASADRLVKSEIGQWCWLRTAGNVDAGVLGCCVATPTPDSDSLTLVLRLHGMHGVPVKKSQEVFVDGPYGQALQGGGMPDLFAVAVDGHGLPWLHAVGEMASAGHGSLPQVTVMGAGADVGRLPRSNAWHPVDLSDPVQSAAVLAMHAQNAAARGIRLRLFVRGSPEFQTNIRRLARNTGIKAWDVLAEGGLDLAAGHAAQET